MHFARFPFGRDRGPHLHAQALHAQFHAGCGGHDHPMHAAGRRGGGFGPGFGGMGGPGGFGDFGGGRRGPDGDGRRERLLESGDLRLLALHVLRQRPSHGYEVIKAIEDLAGGQYSPSPGTVYPTLAMLEDLGQAELADTSGSRKQYRITAAGEEALAAQQEVLDRVLARLQHLGGAADARRSPAIHRAMHNLKMALHLRFAGEAPSEESLRRIAEAIDRAAVEIERS